MKKVIFVLALSGLVSFASTASSLIVSQGNSVENVKGEGKKKKKNKKECCSGEQKSNCSSSEKKNCGTKTEEQPK